MRILTLAAALILSGAVHANCNLSSARLSAGLVKVGDSDQRVVRSNPDRVVQLETREGGAAGIRYDFHLRGQTLQIYVRAGRVVRACRLRD
jgi:hypothetical protein